METKYEQAWFEGTSKEALARVAQLAAKLYNGPLRYVHMNDRDVMRELEKALLDANFEVRS